MFTGLKRLRQTILDEAKLPDYTGRHLFTTKLRLLIFLSCWALVLVFFPFVWAASPYTPLIFNIAFLVTAICYNNVLHGRAFFSSLFFEIMADFISQTTIVYLLGGKTNHFFLIYILYCIAVGTFYGPRLATLAAIIAVICYGSLLFLLHYDYLPALYYGAHTGGLIEPSIVPIFYLSLMIIFLAIVIYGIRIANYFSKVKEKVLEERNKQLIALHQISSTIHNVSFLEPVIHQVLQGVIQGLGYDICFLALVSRKEEKIHFFAPRNHELTHKMFAILNIPPTIMELSTGGGTKNATVQAIRRKQIVFRNDLQELTCDLEPAISVDQSHAIQKAMGWKKFIIIPLLSERKVIGALIGISKISYVESSSVGILENFASQVAMAIENAYLFDELRDKNSELQEAYRVKSEFLAIMSHELRTPLHAILGFSELLSDGSMGQVMSEQRNALGEIHNNARNLSELINNILDLAKAEAGKMLLSVSEFDLRQTIGQVTYTLSPLINAKKLQLAVNYADPGPLIVCADEARLRQILTNLMSNAIKFTAADGSIRIDARRCRFQDVRHRFPNWACETDEVLYVQVVDTGIGIRAADQHELFHPFKQVDPSFTRRYQGTGLGLALCKELVELHRGRIGVESEEGKGSCFYFAISLDKEM